jgi:hypothetical protein
VNRSKSEFLYNSHFLRKTIAYAHTHQKKKCQIILEFWFIKSQMFMNQSTSSQSWLIQSKRNRTHKIRYIQTIVINYKKKIISWDKLSMQNVKITILRIKEFSFFEGYLVVKYKIFTRSLRCCIYLLLFLSQ